MVINGLVAKPELDGRTGTAVTFDDDKGRYLVELDDTSSLMIKTCNLLPTVWGVGQSFEECSSLFTATRVDVKRLDPDVATDAGSAVLCLLDQMRTEV